MALYKFSITATTTVFIYFLFAEESKYEEIVSRMVKAAGKGVGSPVVVFSLLLPLVAIALGQGLQLVFNSGLM